jgi:hypothetical protein
MNDDEQIIENEIALQRPAVRKDASAVRALLDPDFVEVITTGKAFDREEVIEDRGAGFAEAMCAAVT